MKRKHHGRELWERASAFVASDPIAAATELGSWTAEKLFFVGSYLAQTTRAMTNNPSFPGGLVYVDPFCGNGVCVDKSSMKRFPGAALLAAMCAKPFRKLILVDQNTASLETLRVRITRAQTTSEVWSQAGDANASVSDIVEEIPMRSLSVAFLDPWSLGIHFETIKTLTRNRRVDLLILFPDAMDIDRNVNEYYYSKRSDKLDNAMGDQGSWRSVWDEVKNRTSEIRRQAMVEHYLGRLSGLGYQFHDAHSIGKGGVPLYRVVYASKDQLGLKFWRIAVSEDLSGQRSLF